MANKSISKATGVSAPVASANKPKGTYTLQDFQDMSVAQLRQLTGFAEDATHIDLVNVALGKKHYGKL